VSAWIVSKRDIDALVRGLGQRGIPSLEIDPDTLGTILWLENHASVNARYGLSQTPPEYSYARPVPSAAVYPESKDDYDPDDVLQLVKLIRCYRYQSCEHGGWYPSEAESWTRMLDCAIAEELGYDPTAWHENGPKTLLADDPEKLERYERAPWGL